MRRSVKIRCSMLALLLAVGCKSNGSSVERTPCGDNSFTESLRRGYEKGHAIGNSPFVESLGRGFAIGAGVPASELDGGKIAAEQASANVRKERREDEADARAQMALDLQKQALEGALARKEQTTNSQTQSVDDHWVDGYTRSDGTYVEGHYRTNPDSYLGNNYSATGNVNPYTGKVGNR